MFIDQDESYDKNAEAESDELKAQKAFKELRQRAGESVLNWLNNSYMRDYEDVDHEDSDLRAEKIAYLCGYNECRAEIMRRVADLVLDSDSDCDCD